MMRDSPLSRRRNARPLRAIGWGEGRVDPRSGRFLISDERRWRSGERPGFS